MNINKKIIALSIAGLLLENVIIIGCTGGFNQVRLLNLAAVQKHSLVINANGKFETLNTDAKAIANSQNKTLIKILALENIAKDKNIDKEVQEQIESNLKSAGSEQKFEDSLKKMSLTKETYTENLKYNTLFNKALLNEKITVTDDEAGVALKSNTIQTPKKELKIYSSSNKNSLAKISEQLESKVSIEIQKDTQQGIIRVGESNKEAWDIVSMLADGPCNQLIPNNGGDYIVYNIMTIPDKDRLTLIKASISSQKGVASLNKKIDAEISTFTYSIK